MVKLLQNTELFFWAHSSRKILQPGWPSLLEVNINMVIRAHILIRSISGKVPLALILHAYDSVSCWCSWFTYYFVLMWTYHVALRTDLKIGFIWNWTQWKLQSFCILLGFYTSLGALESSWKKQSLGEKKKECHVPSEIT